MVKLDDTHIKKEELAFQNQVYERVFVKMIEEYDIQLPKNTVAEWRNDIRDIYIKQQETEMVIAEVSQIWDTYIKSNEYQHMVSPKLTLAEQEEFDKLDNKKKNMKEMK